MQGPEDHPINSVRWVELAKVGANDYNPNRVAPNELKLLHKSISEDGFTQPVVTYYDADADRYTIVDGFHRWLVTTRFPDIRRMTGGLLPVVVIDKPIAGRMASTVRHNRARGKHSVNGMAGIVFAMLDEGRTDDEVCAELGLEADELVRLKYVTGFAKLFDGVEYRRAWETRRQIRIRQNHQAKLAET